MAQDNQCNQSVKVLMPSSFEKMAVFINNHGFRCDPRSHTDGGDHFTHLDRNVVEDIVNASNEIDIVFVAENVPTNGNWLHLVLELAVRARVRIVVWLTGYDPGDEVLRRLIGAGVHDIINSNRIGHPNELIRILESEKHLANVSNLLGNKSPIEPDASSRNHQPEHMTDRDERISDADTKVTTDRDKAEANIEPKEDSSNDAGQVVLYDFDPEQQDTSRVYAIHSAGLPGVGKSFISANFSVWLARQGLRTTLLDIHFHQPTQLYRFGVSQEFGWINWDDEQAVDVSNIAPTIEGIENLRVMSVPMGHMLEITQDQIARTIDYLQETQDCIVIDCGNNILQQMPYILRMADQSILVTPVDTPRLNIQQTLLDNVSTAKWLSVVTPWPNELGTPPTEYRKILGVKSVVPIPFVGEEVVEASIVGQIAINREGVAEMFNRPFQRLMGIRIQPQHDRNNTVFNRMKKSMKSILSR